MFNTSLSRSGRIRLVRSDPGHSKVDSFYALRLDVEMYRVINNPVSCRLQKLKSLKDFATAEYMTKYGRPVFLSGPARPACMKLSLIFASAYL